MRKVAYSVIKLLLWLISTVVISIPVVWFTERMDSPAGRSELLVYIQHVGSFVGGLILCLIVVGSTVTISEYLDKRERKAARKCN